MPPVGAGDEIVPAERLAHADGHALLPHVKVGQAWHLRALVELVHLLLEGADLGHLAKHVEVLLELHPGLEPRAGVRAVAAAAVAGRHLQVPFTVESRPVVVHRWLR